MSEIMFNDHLIDANNTVIGLVSLQSKESHFIGKIKILNMPTELKLLLDLYNEYVDDNILSLTDDVQDRIKIYKLKLTNLGSEVEEIRIVEDDIYLKLL